MGMTWRPWLGDLVGVGVCAAVLGHAGALGVRGGPAPKTGGAPAEALTEAAHPRPSPEAIAVRNIFCSACRPPGEANDILADPGRRRTALPLALIAVNFVFGPRQEPRGLVTLRNAETGLVGVFHQGASVLGALITDIHPGGIDLQNADAAEFLDFFPEAAAPVAPATTDRGIRKIAEGRYEIDRAALEAVMGDLNQLARTVRALPELKAGRPAGFRLVEIRLESPLARLGLRRGDVITSINGLELTSVEKAMELYLKLKSASHLSITLDRGGTNSTIQYVIR
jgi:general secretion pathway protein C